MKKCVLLILSLWAAVPALAQKSGNRIYGNTGYYQQRFCCYSYRRITRGSTFIALRAGT